MLPNDENVMVRTPARADETRSSCPSFLSALLASHLADIPVVRVPPSQGFPQDVAEDVIVIASKTTRSIPTNDNGGGLQVRPST
jgi:hypothetical protein